jgi:hypothetical protein
VSILGHPAGKSCAIEGCYLGVNNSYLSKISHDAKGNTFFTLTVYGENGYEANGKAGAPGGWIEVQFSFKVNSKGEVTVSSKETKGYPSVSIYSYDSAGRELQDVWRQTESGNIQDLLGPRRLPIWAKTQSVRMRHDNANRAIQQHATKIRRLHLRPSLLHRGHVAGVVCQLWKKQHIHGHTYEFALRVSVLRACIIGQHIQHCRRTSRLEADARPLGRHATLLS